MRLICGMPKSSPVSFTTTIWDYPSSRRMGSTTCLRAVPQCASLFLRKWDDQPYERIVQRTIFAVLVGPGRATADPRHDDEDSLDVEEKKKTAQQSGNRRWLYDCTWYCLTEQMYTPDPEQGLHAGYVAYPQEPAPGIGDRPECVCRRHANPDGAMHQP